MFIYIYIKYFIFLGGRSFEGILSSQRPIPQNMYTERSPLKAHILHWLKTVYITFPTLHACCSFSSQRPKNNVFVEYLHIPQLAGKQAPVANNLRKNEITKLTCVASVRAKSHWKLHNDGHRCFPAHRNFKPQCSPALCIKLFFWSLRSLPIILGDILNPWYSPYD